MKKLIYFSLIAVFLLGPNVSQAGFGVSPGKIIEDNLVPGSYYETTVYLVQGDPKQDLNINIGVESEYIKDWVTIIDGNQQVIPKGVQQFPLKLAIEVPEDADLNIYKAFLRINTVPEAGNTDGQIAISIGGRIDLELTVGDDIISQYEIISLDILDIKQVEDPTVVVKIRNEGNVSAAPYAASFELFNKFGTVRLGYADFEDFNPVKSFSEESQKITFPVDVRLAPGEYWGEVKIYNDKGEVIKELRTVFDVSEVNNFDLVWAYIVDNIWLVYIAGIAILLIVLVGIIKKIKRRRIKNIRT